MSRGYIGLKVNQIPDIKIKDAKKVTLKLTIEAEEIGEQSNTIDLSVIKIGKKDNYTKVLKTDKILLRLK